MRPVETCRLDSVDHVRLLKAVKHNSVCSCYYEIHRKTQIQNSNHSGSTQLLWEQSLGRGRAGLGLT